MRIAYISFEFPPDTAFGGIATYVDQAARIMAKRGHDVEVFTSSPSRNITEDLDGVKIHRILTQDRKNFNHEILSIFEERFNTKAFDFIESPEFSADGFAIKKQYPSLPLVVKLHTPWFLIDRINFSYLTPLNKIRYLLSGLIRGKFYKPFWKEKEKSNDPDYQIAQLAQQIHSPSVDLGNIVSHHWMLPRNSIITVPYPYIPSPALTAIDIQRETGIVTYVGRLEIRKGLVELAKAIKIILKHKPYTKFRFVGSVQESPKPGLNMMEYLKIELCNHLHNISFLKVPANEIPMVYKETDICVFPSIWENFPNVCLEAMSAGRAIVAGKNGGMYDMLNDCNGGILIDPLKPNEIAAAIIKLLDDKKMRVEMGTNARNKILTVYNQDQIGELMEYHYKQLLK